MELAMREFQKVVLPIDVIMMECEGGELAALEAAL